jgi:hypothetical protein
MIYKDAACGSKMKQVTTGMSVTFRAQDKPPNLFAVKSGLNALGETYFLYYVHSCNLWEIALDLCPVANE